MLGKYYCREFCKTVPYDLALLENPKNIKLNIILDLKYLLFDNFNHSYIYFLYAVHFS